MPQESCCYGRGLQGKITLAKTCHQVTAQRAGLSQEQTEWVGALEKTNSLGENRSLKLRTSVPGQGQSGGGFPGRAAPWPPLGIGNWNGMPRNRGSSETWEQGFSTMGSNRAVPNLPEHQSLLWEPGVAFRGQGVTACPVPWKCCRSTQPSMRGHREGFGALWGCSLSLEVLQEHTAPNAEGFTCPTACPEIAMFG